MLDLDGHFSNILFIFLWVSFYASFYLIWFTEILLVTVAPPLETLLTQFRKLQPSPLEVGDHLMWKFPNITLSFQMIPLF